MKGVSFILFILILLVSCNEQSPFYDSYSPKTVKSQTKYSVDPNTNSEIRKIFEKHYHKDGSLLFHLQFDEDSNVKSRSDYTYNDDKKVEEIIEFDKNGDTLNSFTKVYSHNPDGQVYEIEKFDKDGNLQEKRRLEYDDRGNVKIEVVEKGNLKVNEVNYDYTYSNSGELNSIYIRDFENGEIIKKDSIVYSDNGIDLISIDSDGSVNGRKSIKYDDSGNILEELDKDINNKIKVKFIYIYTYY